MLLPQSGVVWAPEHCRQCGVLVRHHMAVWLYLAHCRHVMGLGIHGLSLISSKPARILLGVVVPRNEKHSLGFGLLDLVFSLRTPTTPWERSSQMRSSSETLTRDGTYATASTVGWRSSGSQRARFSMKRSKRVMFSAWLVVRVVMRAPEASALAACTSPPHYLPHLVGDQEGDDPGE